MRNRKVKNVFNQLYSAIEPNWTREFCRSFSDVYAYIDALKSQYGAFLREEFRGCSNRSQIREENMYQCFWAMLIRKFYHAWHENWRLNHPELCADFQNYMKEYIDDSGWEHISSKNVMNPSDVRAYVLECKLCWEPTLTEFDVILGEDPAFVNAVEENAVDILQDMQDEFWYFFEAQMHAVKQEKYSEKCRLKKKIMESEQHRIEMKKMRGHDYFWIRSLLNSRDVLSEKWEFDGWQNDIYHFLSDGDAPFDASIKRCFAKSFAAQDFMIVSASHALVVEPELAMTAIQNARIYNIPNDYRIERGAHDPLAIAFQNGALNEELLRLFSHLYGRCSYFPVSGYWSRFVDETPRFGVIPAYILVRHNDGPMQISSDEFFEMRSLILERFSQYCVYCHSPELVDSGSNALSGLLYFEANQCIPVNGSSIEDILDFYFRMNLARECSECNIEDIRYIRPHCEDENSYERRCVRGEAFWYKVRRFGQSDT